MDILAKKYRAMGVAGILFVDLIWGSSFAVMKNAMDFITPLGLLASRFVLAAVLLWLILGRRVRLIDRRTLLAGVSIGVPLAAAYYFQTIGLVVTTASSSALITGTYVVFIPLLSWALTRRLNRGNLLVGLATLACLALFTMTGELNVLSGDALTLLGALMFGVHFLVLDHWTRQYDTMVLTTLQISVAALCFVLALVLSEPLPTADCYNATVWGMLVYTVLLATIVAFIVQTAAQKVLPPTTASVLFTGESLLGAVCGALLLNETFTALQIVGGLGMIACMIASVRLSAGDE